MLCCEFKLFVFALPTPLGSNTYEIRFSREESAAIRADIVDLSASFVLPSLASVAPVPGTSQLLPTLELAVELPLPLPVRGDNREDPMTSVSTYDS